MHCACHPPTALSISGFATWVDANVPGTSLTTNSTSVAINIPVLSHRSGHRQRRSPGNPGLHRQRRQRRRVHVVGDSPSGGSISASGVYTAGAAGGVTDVVRVTDSLGNPTTRDVTVSAGISIAPATVSVGPRGTQAFTATRRQRDPVHVVAPDDALRRSIDAGHGRLHGGFDRRRHRRGPGDRLARQHRHARRDVGAGVTIAPATASVPPRGTQTFTASGGSGTPYTWSLPTNLSGGSIMPAGASTRRV